MRTLSSALVTELGLTITRPAYLIKINLSTPLYYSTIGNITWNSINWIGYDVKVSGVSDIQGQLILQNIDNTFSSLILNEKVAGKACQIYSVYAGATATGDVVQIFDGVCDTSEISTSAAKINLRQEKLDSPRKFINSAYGFNYLQPAGTVITIGTEKFTLERSK